MKLIKKSIAIIIFVIMLFSLYSILVLYLTLHEILTMAGGLQATLGRTIGQYRYAYSSLLFISAFNVNVILPTSVYFDELLKMFNNI